MSSGELSVATASAKAAASNKYKSAINSRSCFQQLRKAEKTEALLSKVNNGAQLIPTNSMLLCSVFCR